MPCNQIAARGTKVSIFRMATCDHVTPEDITFTTGASAAKAATSITITASSNTQIYMASASYPIWLLFVDADGVETLAKVTSDITVGDTSLQVAALSKAIASGATAKLLLEAKARENASLQPQNKQVEIETLDGGGWKSELNTQWGYQLQLNGYYSPLDPAFLTLREASLPGGRDVYVKVELPNPDTGVYTTGEVYEFFGNVRSTPIETGSASELIKSNFEIMSQGEVTVTYPVPA